MQVEIDEVGIEKIQNMEFLLGSLVSTDRLVYFIPFYQKGDPQQTWLVIDDEVWGSKDGYIKVYTTEEMRALVRSMKGPTGGPVKAGKDIGYRFLVSTGNIRIKVKDGCTGCRRFWGGNSEGQCKKCRRCLDCCSKESVPYSCASSTAQEVKRKRHAWRRSR